MGIFSPDEEPSWSEVVSLQKQIRALNDNYRDLQAENERLHERILKLTEENGSLIVQNNTLKENFEGQRNAYKKLNSMYEENCEYTGKLEQTLQEIKGVVTALYMNNWLQMNETARKSIQLLQDLITKAEEE